MDSLSAALFASQTGVPVILWGQPGIGKTAQISSFAESRHRHLETVIASIRDPTDFCGLPITQDQDGVKTVVYAAPQWAQNIVNHKGGIVFFDEMNTAPRAVMSALLRVTLDKVVGEVVLPQDNTWIIAAANPPEISAGGFDLTAPLANRFAHFEIDPNFESWQNWVCGVKQVDSIPKLPEGWRNFIPKNLAIISSFSRARPMSVQNCPANNNAVKAWPSFRTWTMAASFLAAVESIGEKTNDSLAIQLVTAVVGQSAAIEFFQYMNQLDLKDPEWLLEHFMEWDIPERVDLVYASLTSVIAVFAVNPTNKRWLKCWKFIEYINEKGVEDVGIGAALLLSKLYNDKKHDTSPVIMKILPTFLEVRETFN